MLRQPHLVLPCPGDRDPEPGSCWDLFPCPCHKFWSCCSCRDPGRAGLWEDWRDEQLLELSCDSGSWLCSPGAMVFLWKGQIQRVSQPAGMPGIGRGFTAPSREESGFHGMWCLVVFVSISSELTLNILCFKKPPCRSPLWLTRTLLFKGSHL